MYQTGNVPAAYSPDWIKQELNKLQDAINSPQPFVYLQQQHKEPAKPRDGMVALADGLDWDPGAGAGYYGYQAGAWVKL